MGEQHSVWIVIPAFNEAQVIGGVIRPLNQRGYSVVLVDDGSHDATPEVAAQAGARVVRHPVNLGQGAALQTGLTFALAMGADYLVTFDADGQHRADDIEALLAPLLAGSAHFALGSRRLGATVGAPRLRKVLLAAATLFMRVTTRVKLTDAHNGLRAMTRQGAQALRVRQNRMAHASELISQIVASRLGYVEVPVTIDYSDYSLVKGQRTSDAIKIIIDLAAGQVHR